MTRFTVMSEMWQSSKGGVAVAPLNDPYQLKSWAIEDMPTPADFAAAASDSARESARDSAASLGGGASSASAATAAAPPPGSR